MLVKFCALIAPKVPPTIAAGCNDVKFCPPAAGNTEGKRPSGTVPLVTVSYTHLTLPTKRIV